MRLTRSVDSQGAPAPGGVDIGTAVAVGVTVAAVCIFAAVATCYLCGRRQRNEPARQSTTWKPMKCNVAGSGARVASPRKSSSSHLFSALRPGQRQRRHHVPADDKEASDPAAATPVELDSKESSTMVPREHHAAGQDIGPIAHYQPEPTSLWERPGAQAHQDDDDVFTVSTLATPQPTAWNKRRSGPPPPILIAPSELSRSPSDAYPTYQSVSPPYGYYSHDGFMPDSASSSHSLHSARSYRSTEPLHVPAPTTPSLRSVSVMSSNRRDSGGTHVETPTLLPPTPTYSPSFSPSRRPAIEAVNFVCLGPLPNNIPLPSPRQIQEQKIAQMELQMQQQREAAQSPPRCVTPPEPQQLEQQQQQQQQPPLCDVSPLSPQQQLQLPPPSPPQPQPPTGRSSPPTFHDAIGLRPQPSPASSLFRERSLRVHIEHVDDDDDDDDDNSSDDFDHSYDRLDDDDENENQDAQLGGTLCRQSTDSLGSNFTVEEEERIQAQIAKNLATLGQERVVGTDDMVHIPQFSDKRYSWEDVY